MRLVVVMLTVGLAGLATAFTAPAARAAAAIQVTVTFDPTAPSPDACSLREAIEAANTNTAVGGCASGSATGQDTITVPAGHYTLTIPRSAGDANSDGDLNITGDTVVQGAGASQTTIDAAGIDRVLEVAEGATVTIEGVTVTGGHTRDGSHDPGQGGGNGGDAANGGGISNEGALTISYSTITKNTTGNGGEGGEGGTADFGGNAGSGGGINSSGSGTLTIIGSTIADNTTGSGGNGGDGGFPDNGGNGGAGGGINSSGSGTLTITDSTVADNTTGAGGEAIQGEPAGSGGNGSGVSTGGPAGTLTNVTLAGNGTAPGGAGALFAENAQASLTNVTVADNQADGSDVAGVVGGTLTLANTLLSANENANCGGGVTDGGHDLSYPTSDTSCPSTFVGGDPKLGAPADNGGPTQTQALGAGSAALDQVPSSGAGCPATDQRGVERPQGSACDIGAFELAAAAPTATTGAATTITQTAATLQGTVSGAAVSSCHFEYGTGTEYGSSVPCAQSPDLNAGQAPVSASLSGLQLGTTYHYRLVAGNERGIGEGGDATFTSATPQMAIANPPSMAFPGQAPGTLSAPMVVQISNTGGEPLEIGRAVVTGGQPEDFLISADDCTGATVGPGSSCSIAVRFAPSADGTRTASLNVPSDDPASPLNVRLSGAGGSAPQGPPESPSGGPRSPTATTRASFGAPRVSKLTVRTPVTCMATSGHPCTIRLRLYVDRPKTPHKIMLVGATTVRLAPGHHRLVPMRLNRGGRRLLAAGHTIRARLVAFVGAQQQLSPVVSFKAKATPP